MLKKNAVVEALHRAVAEKGEDYVYPAASSGYRGGACVYSERNEAGEAYPSCIVGHVIAALDPEEFQAIVEYEQRMDESFSVNELIQGKHGSYEIEYGGNRYAEAFVPALLMEDADVESALSIAQSLQDSGCTWGEAQEGFDRVLAGESRWVVENEIRERKREREQGE